MVIFKSSIASASFSVHLYFKSIKDSDESSEDAGTHINATNLRDGGKFDIPTGGIPSPLFGAQPFTQHLLRFEEFGPKPLPSSYSPGTPFPAPLDAESGPANTALDAFLRRTLAISGCQTTTS